MSDESILSIILAAQDKTKEGVDSAEGRMSKLNNTVGLAGKALLGLVAGTLAVGVAAAKFAQQAAEEEVNISRLKTAVENAGSSWDQWGDTIEKTVAKMERTTAFADDELRDALSNLVAETGSLEEGMKRLGPAADLARGAHISLESASRLLGKATDDNVNVLKKYGIEVQKGSDVTELLAKVQERFGGQSEAFGKTAVGQWTILKNQMGNMAEDIGKVVLPMFVELGKVGVEKIDAIRAKFEAIQPQISAIANVVKTGWNWLVKGDEHFAFVEAVQKAFGITIPQSVIVFGNQVATTVSGIIQQVPRVAGALAEMVKVLTGIDPSAGENLRLIAGDELATTIMGTLAAVREGIKNAFEFITPWIQKGIEKLKELKEKFDALPPVVKEFVLAAAALKATGADTALFSMGAGIATMASGLVNVIQFLPDVVGGIAGLIKILPTWIGLPALAAESAAATAGSFLVMLAPIALVIATILLVVEAIIQVWETVQLVAANWDKVMIIWSRTTDAMGTFVRGVLDGLGAFIGGFFSRVGSAVRDFLDFWTMIWHLIVDNPIQTLGFLIGFVTTFVPNMVNNFLSMAGSIKDSVFAWVADTMQAIGTWKTDVGNAIGTFVADAIAGIGKFKTDAWNAILAWITQSSAAIFAFALELPVKLLTGFLESMEKIGKFKDDAIEAAKTMVKGMWEAIEGFISTLPARLGAAASEAITNFVNAVKQGINSFLSGLNVGQQVANLVSGVTGHASGVDMVVNRPTLMRVGEQGTERVRVSALGRQSMGGGDGGPSIAVYVSGDVIGMSPDELTARLGDYILGRMRGSGAPA